MNSNPQQYGAISPVYAVCLTLHIILRLSRKCSLTSVVG